MRNLAPTAGAAAACGLPVTRNTTARTSRRRTSALATELFSCASSRFSEASCIGGGRPTGGDCRLNGSWLEGQSSTHVTGSVDPPVAGSAACPGCHGGMAGLHESITSPGRRHLDLEGADLVQPVTVLRLAALQRGLLDLDLLVQQAQLLVAPHQLHSASTCGGGGAALLCWPGGPGEVATAERRMHPCKPKSRRRLRQALPSQCRRPTPGSAPACRARRARRSQCHTPSSA